MITHKGLFMRKNSVMLFLMMGGATNLFGAASSSSGLGGQADSPDDRKLRLLAGESNGVFVLSIVQSLKNWETSKYVPDSVLIVGPPRNGKASLAAEIALMSGRTCDGFVVRNADVFSLVSDVERRAPHVMVLNKLHLLGRNTMGLDDCLNHYRSNKKLCVIGLCDASFEQPVLTDLFSHRIELQKPTLLSRRDILGYYLAQESRNMHLINEFAEKTEGVSSGKLKILADRLMYLLDQSETKILNRDEIEQELSHFMRSAIPAKRDGISVRSMAIGGVIIAWLATHVWDWAVHSEKLGDSVSSRFWRKVIIMDSVSLISLINQI